MIMKKISSENMTALKKVLSQYPLVQKIVQVIAAQGGRSLLVGGAVRDLFLGIPLKDLDIEVHGLTIEQLENVLQQFGPVSLVGKSFGVLRLHTLDVDWAVPRTDSSGRKPEVMIDPFMPIEDAFRRRDLTINAMGIDLATLDLIDPFGGMQDLKDKLLRAPDTLLFVEDPLRFFRVMQFIGRFEMKPDASLNALCKTMDIKLISRERIEVEFEKLFLKSKCPALGIRWLNEIGRLNDVLPELAQTVDVPQEYSWHPEGDVFEHSMQALDAAVALPYEGSLKVMMLYAALCHDLGKAVTTKKIEGKWRSHAHDQAGVPMAKALLKRITRNQDLIGMVVKLVRHHMAPGIFVKQGAKPAAYKRLAVQLAPDVSMHMLADLAIADKSARNGNKHEPLTDPLPDIQEFVERSEAAQVLFSAQEPVLLGRDLIHLIQPGPKMGMLLKKAYEIQIEEDIHDKEELMRRVLEK